MSYRRTVTARLLDTDASTVISGALDNSFSRNYLKELNGYGKGGLRIQFDDPNVTQLTRGRYIQILINGTPKFAFKIEDGPEYLQIDEGEDAGQYWTVNGRGWGCVFEEGLIYPGMALNLPLDYTYRQWTFASVGNPNISGWGAATEDYEYKDGVTVGWRVEQVVDTGADPDDAADDVAKDYASPMGFPWPNASKNGNGFAPTAAYDPVYWVRADGSSDPEDLGTHLFVGQFVLAGDQECQFQVTGDNYYRLWLQGVPILENIEDALGWMDYKDVTLTLPAGTYTVGAAVENADAAVTFNPGGLLLAVIAMAVYPGDVATTQTLSLLTSRASDLTQSLFVAAGANQPGWRPEQILLQFVSEAQARGEIPAYAGETFTSSLDSNGNPPDSIDPLTSIEFIPKFSMRVGQNGGDMLRQMFDEGWIDWHFSMDTLELNVFNQGTVGTALGVTFAPPTDPNDPSTGNIRGLDRGPTTKYANALLIQYDGGFTEYDDLVEQVAYGARVPEMFSCDAETEEEGLRQGRVDVARKIASATAAILMSVEPMSTTDCPEEGVQLGDYIEVVQADGAGTDSVQVLSIAMDENNREGWAEWRLECNARWRSPQAEVIGVIKTIAGRSVKAGPGGGVARD